MTPDSDLSILIVNWNTRDRTLACINSIRRFQPGQARVQIIVIDNCSEDGSVEAISDAGAGVEIIENKENVGFGRANNAGLERATGRIVLFLNSDTEMTATTIPDLLNEFDAHPEIAAFGCKILGYDGMPQHSVRGFPTLGAYLYSDTFLGMLGFFKRAHDRYRRKQFNFERWQPIEVAMGAALAVRSEVVQQMQGFDPRFFMYFEEADLCKRIHDAGYGLAYSPVPVVYHVGGASSRKSKARMMLVIRQSMFKYFRKHEPALKMRAFSLVFKPLFLMHMIATWLKQLLRAGLARLQPDSRGRRKKYQRRLDVTREFLVKYSVEFLRG
jgi:GT2 family glycosyltransferase